MDNYQLDTAKVLSKIDAEDSNAQLIVMMALLVFSDYLMMETSDQVARRFGTVGSQALSHYGKLN